MAVSSQKLLLEIQIKNQQALGRVEKDVNKLSKSSLTLGKSIQAATAAFAAFGAVNIAKSIVQTTARFEDLRTSLSAVTGSAQAGQKAFDGIIKFSTRTQFGVEDLSKTFIKLKASGIEPTEELLTTFTDTAAITTDQIGTLEAITDLFSRTVSGGLGLEELNRLADRGVPVFRILEEQLGITRLEVSEFGKTAEGAKQITDALATGIRQQYGGATAKIVGNLSTQFSNFSIALKNAADQFGQALAPEIKQATQELTDFIEKNKDDLPAVAKEIAEFSKTVFKLTKDIASGFKDLYNLADELGLGEIGIIGFLLLGTKGKLAVTALAGITTALKKFNQALKEAGDNAKQTGDDLESPDDALNSYIDTTQYFSDVQKDAIKPVFDFGSETESTANAQKYYGKELGKVIALYDDYVTDAELAANETARIKKEQDELVKAFKKTFSGQVLRGLEDYAKNLKQIAKDYETAKIVADTLTTATKTFASTAQRELADVVLGTKRLEDALGNIGRAILRDLIEGFIRLAIVKPILDALIPIFNALIKSVYEQVRGQKALNSELKQEIGLRLILAAIGGGGGGGFNPFNLFRANGGPVISDQSYIVGERGPELFIPRSSGSIVPNDELQGAGGGNVTVNFNVTTLDAKSFDELLLSRKGVIIGTIQSAFRQNGRRFS